MRRIWLSVGLLVAVGALGTSVAFAVAHSQATRPGSGGMMGGSGQVAAGPAMMGAAGMGAVWLPGDSRRVTSISAARDRATTAASNTGLHPGEVIWFDNGFYVELKDTAGNPATEVIVAPTNGSVSTEPGPATMWNTSYGPHRSAATTPNPIAPDRAQQLATDWLAINFSGRLAQPPDAYPGYYTLETTTSSGTVNGMLSVNASTGQIWYHTWHGRFIAKEDT